MALLVVIGGDLANGITPPRALDLDDLGAEIAENRRAEGAGQHARQVDDAYAVEGHAHRGGQPLLENASTRQLVDALVRVAGDPSEDLGRVLADRGRSAAHGGWRL